ncbi:unnamed protein product [Prorocentrum cordatum]|uniref:Uncharacterized protein n=1 Tax=Prorocentrum cordatum TaxID=2364126 RepID=A0ABN9SX68_9DINO|nr:unnamed protein product [Polarella glacialis]
MQPQGRQPMSAVVCAHVRKEAGEGEGRRRARGQRGSRSRGSDAQEPMETGPNLGTTATRHIWWKLPPLLSGPAPGQTGHISPAIEKQTSEKLAAQNRSPDPRARTARPPPGLHPVKEARAGLRRQGSGRGEQLRAEHMEKIARGKGRREEEEEEEDGGGGGGGGE